MTLLCNARCKPYWQFISLLIFISACYNMLLHKGCWEYHGGVKSCVVVEQMNRCVTGRPHKQPDHRGHDVFFCCCKSPMCNVHFEYDPSVGSPEAEEPPLNSDLIGSANPYTVVTSSPHDSLHNALFAFVPIFLLTAFFILGYFAYRKFRMSRRHVDCDRGELKSLSSRQSSRKPQHNQQETTRLMVKPPIELTKDPIAVGRYGTVYLGRYVTKRDDGHGTADGLKTAQADSDQNRQVAVKVSRESKIWADECEVYNIAAIKKCQNVLLFLGIWAKNSSDEYWIITEYHKNGSIYDYIKCHTIDLGQLLHIAKTMLDGLAFLHEEVVCEDKNRAKPTIVHRDFKSSNVLLKQDLTACVADFGLSLQCRQGRTPSEQHKQAGTDRYMAPELLETATEYSAFAFKQMDVYAAAIVCWELLSRCKVTEDTPVAAYRAPYEKELGLLAANEAYGQTGAYEKEFGEKPNFKLALLRHVATDRNRPILEPHWKSDRICETFCCTVEEMWDQEPEARITARCALERVERMQKNFLLENCQFSDCTDEILDTRVHPADQHKFLLQENVV